MSLAPLSQPAELTDQPARLAALGPAAASRLRTFISFPVLLGALLVAGVFASVSLNLQNVQSTPGALGSSSVFEGDTWFDLAMGEQILKTHEWPSKETWSFTAEGNDFIVYEWLGDVIWAATSRLGGLRALAGLLITLAAAIMLLLYYYATLRSGNCKAAFVACILLLPLAAAFFNLRPQLLGYLFLLVTMICLERFRQGKERALWFLPPIFLLWVNTHGSFILGLVVLGVYWASGLARFRRGSVEALSWTPRQRRQLAIVSLLSLIALMITPYGSRLATTPAEMLLHSRLGLARIVEYAPLGAFDGLLKPFLALLVLFVAGQIAARAHYRLEEVLLLVLTIYGAWVHMRLLFFFVFVFTPLLAVLLARWAPAYKASKDRFFLNAALIVMIAGAMARYFPARLELQGAVARTFPAGAVNYMKGHAVPGPMFNEGFWGDYLVRTLGPGHKIFMDGRSQLYEEARVLGDYLDITDVEPQTELLLRKYGVNSCLIERDSALATLLASSPRWDRAYQDDLSVLFVRRQVLSRKE